MIRILIMFPNERLVLLLNGMVVEQGEQGDEQGNDGDDENIQGA